MPEIGLSVLILGLFWLSLHPDEKTEKSTVWMCATGYISIALSLPFLWNLTANLFNGMFQINSLAIFLKGIFLVTGLLTTIMINEFMTEQDKRKTDFYLLIAISTLGTLFLASANDLITLFITVEWITISLYVLTAYLKTDNESLESGMKYLIMGAFSAGFFLYGISFVYGTCGGTHFEQIRQFLAAHPEGNALFWSGALLILAGIGFKIALFPFQLWVPDVYQGAPTPVTAFLAAGSKAAGFAALAKVLFLCLGIHSINWSFLIACLSAFTLLYGNLGALRQTNIKRLLAYSGIAHAGYLLMGFSSASKLGMASTLFYLAVYVAANLTVFTAVVIVGKEMKSNEISDYRGLSRKSPLLAASLFIALLSLGGIPPLAGSFGKFFVIVSAQNGGYIWLASLGAVNVIISLYYYLIIVKEMYLRKSDFGPKKIKISRPIAFTFGILVLIIIGFGFFQAPLFHLAEASANSLF